MSGKSEYHIHISGKSEYHIHINGDKWWHLNGKLHREDGPAIEFANGGTEYWINGKCIPQLDNKRIYGKENLQKLLLLI